MCSLVLRNCVAQSHFRKRVRRVFNVVWRAHMRSKTGNTAVPLALTCSHPASFAVRRDGQERQAQCHGRLFFWVIRYLSHWWELRLPRGGSRPVPGLLEVRRIKPQKTGGFDR
jgi:hypothetical protein